jgi:hypothetical protein
MNTRLKPFFTPAGSLRIPGMKDQHLIDSTRIPNTFFELGASCIRPVYYELRPFAHFEYTLLIKKKKQ